MTASSVSTIKAALLASGVAMALVACAAEQPQSTVSRNLGSGVTSSNGGGMMPANFGTLGPTRVR